MSILSTASLTLHVDPARGGKVTSLRDRRSGREWLLTPAQPMGTPAGYGACFVDEELSGWDEMVPTIVAGAVELPHGTIETPDHGEVWSIAWDEVVEDPTSLSMGVDGRALPYRFERVIRIVDHDRLRFDYRLEHRGDEPFPWLWAAHPQFVWRTGGRVEFPAAIEQVLDVMSNDAPQQVTWDRRLATLLDHLDQGRGHKVWTLPGSDPRWVRLRDPDGGSLTMHLDPRQVPYLGIWWDAEAHATARVLALEPSNGFYDDLVAAAARGRAPYLLPGAEARWSLALQLRPPVRDQDPRRGSSITI